MKYRFQYTDNVNRQKIVDQNEGKILIEEQNLLEGNFLVFVDKIPFTIEQKLEFLGQDNLILMDALAMTFEEVMMLRAEIGGTI